MRTSNGARWTFPKGHRERGETLAEAAAREAAEEAGVSGRIDPEPLAQYRYPSRGGDALVTAFLLEVDREGLAAERDRDPTWFGFEAARSKLAVRPRKRLRRGDGAPAARGRSVRSRRPRADARPGDLAIGACRNVTAASRSASRELRRRHAHAVHMSIAADPTSGRRAATKAANRAAIIAAARAVFAEMGYGGATVRDVVRRTDLASGTFYNYFPDKESLFRARAGGERGRGPRARAGRAPRRRGRWRSSSRAGYREYFGFLASEPETFELMRRNSGTIRAMFDEPIFGAGRRGARGRPARRDRGGHRAGARRRVHGGRDGRRRVRGRGRDGQARAARRRGRDALRDSGLPRRHRASGRLARAASGHGLDCGVVPPSFCRHNRFVENCPICRAPGAAAGRAAPPARRRAGAALVGARASRGSRSAMRVRKLTQAADDGYRNELVAGLKASADAERLAAELAFATARLAELAADPPGAVRARSAPSPIPRRRSGSRSSTAYLSPTEGEDPFAAIRAAHVPWASGELPDLDVALGLRTSHEHGGGRRARCSPTAPGRSAPAARRPRSPARRRGRPSAASTASSSASRCRASAAPGATSCSSRSGASASSTCAPSTLQLTDDATTVAAKRVFGIGDKMLLERRARELADAAELPIEALDLALFNWAAPQRGRATMGSTRRAVRGRASPRSPPCSASEAAQSLRTGVRAAARALILRAPRADQRRHDEPPRRPHQAARRRGSYPIDEAAIAEAIIVRSLARAGVPGIAFRLAAPKPPVRSFRHHSGARSFRLHRAERRPATCTARRRSPRGSALRHASALAKKRANCEKRGMTGGRTSAYGS